MRHNTQCGTIHNAAAPCDTGGIPLYKPKYMIGAGALHAGARADVHVLIVGDPGMGKSQMLTAAVSHAGLQPRTSRPLLTRQLSAYAHVWAPPWPGLPRPTWRLRLRQHELVLGPHRDRGQGRHHRRVRLSAALHLLQLHLLPASYTYPTLPAQATTRWRRAHWSWVTRASAASTSSTRWTPRSTRPLYLLWPRST